MYVYEPYKRGCPTEIGSLIRTITIPLYLNDPTGGYDSDVDREKKMDYSTKTYAQSSHDPSLIKPHQQAAKQEVGVATGKRGVVSRSVAAVRKVVTNDAAPAVKVS